jgi:quinoprotein relay system zinc metallohydrolase 2
VIHYAHTMKTVLAAITLLWIGPIALAMAPAAADAFAMDEVAPGVFVHAGLPEYADRNNHGDIANAGFIIGAEAVAVIDTGNSPAIGRSLRDAIRQRTELPIRYVVNTHMHPDHIFGNAAFAEDHPVFVAHAGFQSALMARADSYQRRLEEDLGPEAARDATMVPPTRTVEAQTAESAPTPPLKLDLGGGRVIELTAWPTAHTNNDLTVLDPASGTLFAGDLVFLDRLPTIDGSAIGWLKVMDRLAGVAASMVVPGHGPSSASWPQAMEPQRLYLTTLIDDIRAIQKRGGTIEQAAEQAASSQRDRWRLFDEDNPRNAVTVFAELEWE